MKINFSKYHGTANDFIIIDNISNDYVLNENIIGAMCNYKTGIGADGLLLLNKSTEYAFEMNYFNSDGKEASFCGNGGRCIAAYAYKLGVTRNKMIYKASDGIHNAEILHENKNVFNVKLSMNDVGMITKLDDIYITNTGSPHAIIIVDDLGSINVFEEGKKIRYSHAFKENGINVNFVKVNLNCIEIRTYERGVEDETFSCGTGVTASALYAAMYHNQKSPIKVITKGGILWVYFDFDKNKGFSNIVLEGEAVFVFDGTYYL